GFDFVPNDSFASKGSFTTDQAGYFTETERPIPINPTKTYKISMFAKSENSSGTNYIGHTSYDKDLNRIESQHTIGGENPILELAQDVNYGDTVIYVKSTDGLKDDVRDGTEDPEHTHSLVFWGYKNEQGREYEAGTYSRYVFMDGWDFGAIDRDLGAIHLNRPFDVINKDDPSGSFRAGNSKLSATRKVEEFQYSVMNGQTIPTDGDEDYGRGWYYYDSLSTTLNNRGTNSFPYGTFYIKLAFLLNTDTMYDRVTISDIEMYDVTGLESVKRELVITNELISHMMTKEEIDVYKQE